MASGNLLEFTDKNFKTEVLDATVPVLVDFWAEWCQPCKMLTPTIQMLADEFAGKVKVGKIDTDANTDTAVQFGIISIPTVIIFKNGQVAKKLVGLQGKDEYAKALAAVS